ncbi:bone morphogenetic protein 3 isoform X2 [Gallus gallus]|uniref:bone morphogenetic protein 3 isoform X2 n=1 Tax=Gallus gallus TaxID=9031 RepID=UPI001F0151D6|nr:bone morphogenetic protein 3 isoform X2 [Gallus gallus]
MQISPVCSMRSLQEEKTSFLLFGYCSLEACFISARLQAELLPIPQQKFSVMRETCDLRALEKKLCWEGTSDGRAAAGHLSKHPAWRAQRSSMGVSVVSSSAGFPNASWREQITAQFPGSPGSQELYVFNLTSLTKSENILSASLHYYIGDLLDADWNCSQSGGCSHRGHRKPEIQIHLSVWTFPSVGNQTRGLGHFLINISSSYSDVLSWQWKDITQVLHKAKQSNELLIGVKMDSTSRHLWRRAPFHYEPYILIYANDSAISEPESVVSSLQGHHNPLARVFPRPENHMRSSLGKRRRKRSTNVLLPLQNNELPGAEYQYNEDERWEDRKPYKTFQPRLAERAKSKKKQRKNHHQKSQTLQFDEQTLKKARRKQWNEPRYCARRYLKVDFADIGWSEWIISPKSFDAYYCSGECQFPIPKALKPSNHATIQSIVRAVGVVPGIPEPCCVPDKMSSLSILFFDENKNVVLKVYPNMTVESCACR